GYEFESAGRGFCEHAGRLWTMAGRGHDRADGEGGGRAQNGADIVRVGDLIEYQYDAVGFEFGHSGSGEGVGLRQEALMDGVRPKAGVDDLRTDQFWFDRERYTIIGEAARRVLRCQQAANA